MSALISRLTIILSTVISYQQNLSATEIIALVTGVIGGLTALLTVLSCIREPLTRRHSYLKNRKENLEKLLNQTEEVKLLLDRVVRELKGNKVHKVYPYRWMENVRKIVEEVNDLSLGGRLNETCLCGCLPDYTSRIKIGKLIAEKITLIDKLLEEGQAYAAVTESSGRGNIRFSKQFVGVYAAEIVEEMWRYVMKDNDIRTIGVHGMGGIGKTSIVTEINNRILMEIKNLTEGGGAQILEDSMCFDNVIWVDVPYESNLMNSHLTNLQMMIAKEINFDLPSNAAHWENRDKLMDALLKRERYLLILDDMWRPFSLEEIGIPKPTKENSCKIIVTSRFSSVCSNIRTDKNVEIKLLSEEEEWVLFMDEVGPNVFDMPEETQCIMKNVAKECGGLPLAVITVARALRKLNENNKDQIIIKSAWERALTALRESSKNLDYMGDKVFASLRFSYERLKNTSKPCFLYCALYPKNHHIEAKELMEYWIWEGLLGNVGWIDDSMRQAEDILEELKEARLLESAGIEGGVEQVKMHPLTRDMAINITTTSTPPGEDMAINITTECPPTGSIRFFILAGLGLTKPPYAEQWPEDVNRVSMMRNDIKEIWYAHNCPDLSTLLLQYNSIDLYFNEDFFHRMPNLKVLDLSFTGVRALPQSIKFLKNLQALLLRNCWNLTDLPSLSMLEALMILDVSDTHIRLFPEGMFQLTKLRRLNLSRCHLSHINPEWLLVFQQVQELLMDGFDFSVFRGRWLELQIHLPNLVVLEGCFCDAQVFREYMDSGYWYQLRSFKFWVGGLYNGKSGKNSLTFMGESLLNDNPIMLPNKTFELHIIGCESITQLTLPILENLKIVDVSECANLKYLLKDRMLQNVPNLEEIAIKRCPNMVEVIEQEAADLNGNAITFPRLKKLMLFDIPKLECIYKGTVVCESLQTIAVWNCNNLKKFPVMLCLDEEPKLLTPHGLEEIRGERDWFESLEWDLPNAKTLLQCLFIEESLSI